MIQEINGFKIISQIDKKYYIVQCKLCFMHVKMRIDGIKKNISCGCSWKTNNIPRRLQSAYAQMKERCYGNSNPRNVRLYENIFVCNEWLNNSKSFYKWALENDYKENLTLDRIDNKKGYSPENCRWATKSQQQRNRNCSRFSEEDVRFIRNNSQNFSRDQLVKRFNCTPGAISRIINRTRFQDIV